MVIMNDLEWPMLSYLLFDLVWKGKKSHAVNIQGSFKTIFSYIYTNKWI